MRQDTLDRCEFTHLVKVFFCTASRSSEDNKAMSWAQEQKYAILTGRNVIKKNQKNNKTLKKDANNNSTEYTPVYKPHEMNGLTCQGLDSGAFKQLRTGALCLPEPWADGSVVVVKLALGFCIVQVWGGIGHRAWHPGHTRSNILIPQYNTLNKKMNY